MSKLLKLWLRRLLLLALTLALALAGPLGLLSLPAADILVVGPGSLDCISACAFCACADGVCSWP